MKRLASKAIAAGATIVGSSIAFATSVAAQTYSYDYTPYTYSTGDAAAVTAMGIGQLLWICCCCGIAFLPTAAIFYFVYSDAKKYGVTNPLLWGLVSITWVGLLVYLLAIRQDAIREFEKKNHVHHASQPQAETPKSE